MWSFNSSSDPDGLLQILQIRFSTVALINLVCQIVLRYEDPITFIAIITFTIVGGGMLHSKLNAWMNVVDSSKKFMKFPSCTIDYEEDIIQKTFEKFDFEILKLFLKC